MFSHIDRRGKTLHLRALDIRPVERHFLLRIQPGDTVSLCSCTATTSDLSVIAEKIGSSGSLHLIYDCRIISEGSSQSSPHHRITELRIAHRNRWTPQLSREIILFLNPKTLILEDLFLAEEMIPSQYRGYIKLINIRSDVDIITCLLNNDQHGEEI